MRENLTGLVFGLLLSAISAAPVYAQTPPEQIRDYPGLTYLGQIGGLEAWALDGSDALWMRAPDGRGLIRGEMFSAAGRDLGAALTGSDPASLRDALGVTGPDWSEPSAELASEALRLTMTGTFSLLLGEEGAPEVWAWADLSDPAISATYMMLRDLIEAGEIGLRVIPIVTSGPGSSELILRAISTPGPVGALKGLIRGERLPADAALDEEALAISGGLISRIEANGALASRISPPGLPFLMWSREGGPAVFQGVPRPEIFDGVMRITPPDLSDAD
jgi:hypothetical protein